MSYSNSKPVKVIYCPTLVTYFRYDYFDNLTGCNGSYHSVPACDRVSFSRDSARYRVVNRNYKLEKTGYHIGHEFDVERCSDTKFQIDLLCLNIFRKEFVDVRVVSSQIPIINDTHREKINVSDVYRYRLAEYDCYTLMYDQHINVCQPIVGNSYFLEKDGGGGSILRLI